MGKQDAQAACLVCTLIVVAIALTEGVCPAQTTDPYEEAMARSAQHERRGDLGAATKALEEVLPRYPQDYEIALRLAGLYCRRERFADAQRLYRAALSRSSGAGEAVLGLRLCAAPRPVRYSAAVALGVQVYPQRPVGQERSPSLGTTVHLDALIAGHFALGATYRYRANLPAIDLSGLSLLGQHEAYFDAGYGTRAFGLTAHYGLIADQGGLGSRSHHAGLAVRYSPLGDLLLDLSASFYSDLIVLRGEPSWRIPIRFGLSIQPALGVQWTPQQSQPHPLVNGLLTLLLQRPGFSLWLGGKYGDEVRPAYLDVPVIYNLPETLTYGAYAGGSVHLRGFRLALFYALDRLCPTDGSAGSFTHAIALGLSRGF